jgi:hypothetical protein
MLADKLNKKKRFKDEKEKKRFLGAKDINDVGNESMTDESIDLEDNCLAPHQQAYDSFKEIRDSV